MSDNEHPGISIYRDLIDFHVSSTLDLLNGMLKDPKSYKNDNIVHIIREISISSSKLMDSLKLIEKEEDQVSILILLSTLLPNIILGSMIHGSHISKKKIENYQRDVLKKARGARKHTAQKDLITESVKSIIYDSLNANSQRSINSVAVAILNRVNADLENRCRNAGVSFKAVKEGAVRKRIKEIMNADASTSILHH